MRSAISRRVRRAVRRRDRSPRPIGVRRGGVCARSLRVSHAPDHATGSSLALPRSAGSGVAPTPISPVVVARGQGDADGEPAEERSEQPPSADDKLPRRTGRCRVDPGFGGSGVLPPMLTGPLAGRPVEHPELPVQAPRSPRACRPDAARWPRGLDNVGAGDIADGNRLHGRYPPPSASFEGAYVRFRSVPRTNGRIGVTPSWSRSISTVSNVGSAASRDAVHLVS